MIRGAMEVGDWRLGMVLGCSGEAVERLCTGIEVYLGFGHNDTIEAVLFFFAMAWQVRVRIVSVE